MSAARRRLVARRQALGLTQRDLAERVGVAVSSVARCERGESTPRLWYLQLYADALEVSREDLDDLLTFESGEPISVGRVDSAGIGTGGLVIVGAERMPTGRVGAGYVDDLRQQVAQLVTLDTRYGGDDVARLAARAFRAASRRLASGLYVPAIESDLQATVGELAQVASWVAFDAERQDAARTLVHEALYASRLAGDQEMVLFELAHLAMHSVYTGRPAEARQVAEGVLEADRLTTRTEAVFRLRLARALAQVGERQRSMAQFREARGRLSDGVSDRDPAWTWWLDESELAWHEGMALEELGEHGEAAERLRQALELRPALAHRARYNDLAHLAMAQVRACTWHDAERSMVELASYPDDISSARTAVVLRSTIAAVRRSGRSTTVTDAADELATLLGAS